MTPTELSNSSLKRLFNKHNRSSQLTLSLASLGLLLLLVGTFTLPFNQGLFLHLFTKPASHADTMMMGPQHIGCTFLSDPNAKPAFCDTFQTPAPGGRGGDLDESHWDFSRETGDNNTSQGLYDFDIPTFIQYCKTQVVGILPIHDSFFCGDQFNEANHWMEAFNDHGNFTWNDAMIRQPFDFTNRTGTITFESDAKTAGGHFTWLQLMVSDQPVPAANSQIPGDTQPNPQNGLLIIFADDCNDPYNQMAISSVEVIQNYQGTKNFVPNQGLNNVQCVKTAADMANHFEVRLSQNSLQVWASDDDQTNFREIASADNLNLNFTKGYVHFQHVDYNPVKYGQTGQVTYHWHNLGFDGPILPLQRGYSIPEADAPAQDQGAQGVNLGYGVKSDGIYPAYSTTPLAPFTIPNVDLSNATGAFLSLDALYVSPNTQLQYQWNNGTWRDYNLPTAQTVGWFTPLPILIPIALSDLQTGTNTLSFKQTTPSTDPNAPYASVLQIQDIDLTVQTSVIPSPPPPVYMYSPQPSLPPFPLPQFNVTTTSHRRRLMAVSQ